MSVCNEFITPLKKGSGICISRLNLTQRITIKCIISSLPDTISQIYTLLKQPWWLTDQGSRVRRFPAHLLSHGKYFHLIFTHFDMIKWPIWLTASRSSPSITSSRVQLQYPDSKIFLNRSLASRNVLGWVYAIPITLHSYNKISTWTIPVKVVPDNSLICAS